jgi:hypothetical protein
VPALGAAFDPIFGNRSLQIVSLLGYVAIGVFVYALLRRRFPVATSVTVAVGCLWLPPVRSHSFRPMTDSWGLALLLIALMMGLLALERGGFWMLSWALAVLALSVTREDSHVVAGAACCVALWVRTKRTIALAVTGAIAILPASLLLGASLRETLAYTENNFRRPADSGWSFVSEHYLHSLRSTLRGDLLFPQLQHWSLSEIVSWYSGCAVVVCAILLLLSRGGADPFFQLIRATLLSGAAYIALSVNFSGLRLELVFLPAIAVGLAVLLENHVRPALAAAAASISAASRRSSSFEVEVFPASNVDRPARSGPGRWLT